MAVLRWSGSSDGVTWSTAGNWIDEGTGSTAGAAPADGDSVKILTGNWQITAGLSQGSVDLVDFLIGPQFTGTIGSNGTSLTIAVSGTLTYNGRASLCNITAGTNGIAKCKVLSTAGQFNLSGGTWTQVEAKGGNTYITSSATVTTLYGAGGNVTAESGSSFTTVQWKAGRFQSARSITTLDTAGIGTVANTIGTAAITTCSVNPGALFRHQSSGTITTLNAYTGAVIDAKDSLYGFTVTTANIWSDARVFEESAVAISIGTENLIGSL